MPSAATIRSLEKKIVALVPQDAGKPTEIDDTGATIYFGPGRSLRINIPDIAPRPADEQSTV